MLIQGLSFTYPSYDSVVVDNWLSLPMRFPQSPPTSPAAVRQKRLVLLAYVLHALAPFLILATAIVGVVINYLQRAEAKSPWRDHHDWMIRTFWLGLLGWGLGLLTVGILIGWPILVITGIWWLYRMVRGLLRLSENRPPSA